MKEQLSPEEDKRRAIDKLIILRDEWSEEIPEEIKHSSDEDKLYKVRGTWFQGVISTAEHLIHYYLSPQIKDKNKAVLEEIASIQKYFTDSEKFHGKMASRTNVDDIKMGNRLIELTLSLFEKNEV